MKKIVISLITVLILTSLIMNVSAEDIIIPDNVPFSISSWFSHTFNIPQFSVVGNDQQCGGASGQPDYEHTFQAGDNSRLSDLDVCNGQGLFDVFSVDFSHPYQEFSADLDGSTRLSSSQSWIIQEYCCPNPEPYDQADCTDWGLGTFHKVTCSVWNNGNGLNGYNCKSNSQIPYHHSSYNYCECSTQTILYYYSGSGSTCSSNPYCCSGGNCPTSTAGKTLYTSKSTCESNIVPTCSSLNGQICLSGQGCTGSVVNSIEGSCCLGACQLNTCPTGQERCSDGTCKTTGTCSGGERICGKTGRQGICRTTCLSNEHKITIGLLDGDSCSLLTGDCCAPNTNTCPTGTTLCGDGTCKADCSNNGGTGGGSGTSGTSGKLSLTEGAFGEATAETIIKATCSLGSECPRDKEHILTDEYANVEDYNWTVRCMTSASIQMSNKASIEAYVKKKGVVISWIYGETCKDTTVYSLSNWITSMIGLDLCKTIESELPSGTCRASPTSSGCIWSEPHKWIGKYTKADCNTDLMIFIFGVVGLLIIVLKFAG